MRILMTTILASGLLFGTAGIANAQLDFLKDKAQETVAGQVTGQVSGQVSGQASGLLGNSGSGSLTSSQLSTSETITAGKVLLGGGSTSDAAIAVGRSRVESRSQDLLGSQLGNVTGGVIGGSSSSGGVLGNVVGGSSSSSGGVLGNVIGGSSSSGDVLGNVVDGSSSLGGLLKPSK